MNALLRCCWITGIWLTCCVGWSAPFGCAAAESSQDELKQFVAAVNEVGAEGKNHAAAIAAMQAFLANEQPPLDRLLLTLDAMEDAMPRGKNWLLMTASTMLDRAADDPQLGEAMLTFFNDRSNDPDARYFAFRQLVANADDQGSTKAALLDRSRDDPSLPLRFLAIEKAIEDADAMSEEANQKSLLSEVLVLARHPDHLREISDRLSKLGMEVDLSAELAMIDTWHVIAPFDNTDGVGFDTVYPVEANYLTDADGSLRTDRPVQIDDEKLAWLTQTTSEAMGMVDLNPTFDNAKNAVAYAYVVVEIDEDQLAGFDQFEARLGCICASRAWVNGELVLSNEVYHSGSSIDQYVGSCQLQPGRNTILLKICQNDQTEPWAQDFQFQFRLTDPTGRGLQHRIISPAVE